MLLQGSWNSADLVAWRKGMKWTQTEAAEQLGVSLRAYQDREAGKTKITRETALACVSLGAQGADIAQLRSTIATQAEEIERLRLVCAEAYQFAGAHNAPVEVLDNLDAAASGEPLPHESFLPVAIEKRGRR
jgi:transcriptional regulator with XRE-family HTH domain